MNSTETPSPGRSKAVLYAFGALVLLNVAFGAAILLRKPRPAPAPSPALLVHCTANLRTSLETIAAEFRAATGQRVQFNSGGAAALLEEIQTTRRGDLLVTDDDAALTPARIAELVAEAYVIPQDGRAQPAAEATGHSAVTIATLKTSSQPEAARRFAEYATDPEKGRKRLAEWPSSRAP